MSFEDKLAKAMENAGVHIDGEINWASRDFQRFRVKNHWKRGKPLFVILSGTGASFGDFRNPSNWQTVWEKSWRDITREEREERELHFKKIQHEKELLRKHAIWRSQLMLDHKTFLGDTCFEADHDHPYIIAKRIIPYYAKQIRSYLILPIHDANYQLQSLQYIKTNGFKQFKKHATPKGGIFWLSESLSKDYDGVIRICEGYATGCSIYEAVGSPVLCALSAQNLVDASILLRKHFIHARFKICADNDQWQKDNIGLIKARIACEATGAALHYPIFDHLKFTGKPTDFNDLFCIGGIEELEKQLLIIRK